VDQHIAELGIAPDAADQTVREITEQEAAGNIAGAFGALAERSSAPAVSCWGGRATLGLVRPGHAFPARAAAKGDHHRVSVAGHTAADSTAREPDAS